MVEVIIGVVAIAGGCLVGLGAYNLLDRLFLSSPPDEPVNPPPLPRHPTLDAPPPFTALEEDEWDYTDAPEPDDDEFTFDPLNPFTYTSITDEPYIDLTDDATSPPEFSYTPPPPTPDEERDRVRQYLEDRLGDR